MTTNIPDSTALVTLATALQKDEDATGSDLANFGSENLYEILGVYPFATQEEIKVAYRRLAQRLHPDRDGRADKTASNVIFSKVSRAYTVLKDPKTREFYDATGLEPLTDKAMLDRATNVAMEILTKVCDEMSASDSRVATINPILVSTRAADDFLAQLTRDIAANAKMLNGLLAIQKRFRKKTKAFDETMLGSILSGKVKQCLTRKNLLGLDVSLYGLAKTVISNYDYENDAPVVGTIASWSTLSPGTSIYR